MNVENVIAPESSSKPNLAENKRYQRLKHIGELIGMIVGIVGLLLAVWLGPRVNVLVQELVGPNRWLRLIALGFVYAAGFELLSLPVDFWAGFVLEHQFQLSRETFLQWWWKRFKMYLVGGPLGLALLLGLYSVLWFTGPLWWLAAALGWLAVTLVLGRILPVVILPLFYKVTRLDNPALQERFRRLADGTGLKVEGVYTLGLSKETKKANAALTGMGRTRRVLLGDTLLQQFEPDEIDVVFTHELGHHVHKHLPKFIVMEVMLTAMMCFLADRMLAAVAVRMGYPGPLDPAALPLFLLVVGIFGLCMMPLRNAISRWFERQSDCYALQRTGNAAAYRSAFTKLAEINKADPDPNRFLVWLWHDHPPIRERLAMADQLLPQLRPETHNSPQAAF
ncbi:MAG TPA: M48 family metallopeptidase [Gemmataceae bacterium]|nr:M48 family metallopeptidase [Gemmataceae bacterium]